jgi:hypothetical protein
MPYTHKITMYDTEDKEYYDVYVDCTKENLNARVARLRLSEGKQKFIKVERIEST